jgi:hypothetical protein
MLHGRESDGPQRVVTATQRASRPPLPPAARRKTALVAFRLTPPIARFLFSPVKIDDLLPIAVTSRCKTGENKQLVTG